MVTTSTCKSCQSWLLSLCVCVKRVRDWVSTCCRSNFLLAHKRLSPSCGIYALLLYNETHERMWMCSLYNWQAVCSSCCKLDTISAYCYISLPTHPVFLLHRKTHHLFMTDLSTIREPFFFKVTFSYLVSFCIHLLPSLVSTYTFHRDILKFDTKLPPLDKEKQNKSSSYIKKCPTPYGPWEVHIQTQLRPGPLYVYLIYCLLCSLMTKHYRQ